MTCPFADPEIPALSASDIPKISKSLDPCLSDHVPILLVARSWIFPLDMECFLLGSWPQNPWISISQSQLSPLQGSALFVVFFVYVVHRKFLYLIRAISHSRELKQRDVKSDRMSNRIYNKKFLQTSD